MNERRAAASLELPNSERYPVRGNSPASLSSVASLALVGARRTAKSTNRERDRLRDGLGLQLVTEAE